MVTDKRTGQRFSAHNRKSGSLHDQSGNALRCQKRSEGKSLHEIVSGSTTFSAFSFLSSLITFQHWAPDNRFRISYQGYDP